jgi:hypothetical protein
MSTKKLLIIGAVAVGGFLLYTRVIKPATSTAPKTSA